MNGAHFAGWGFMRFWETPKQRLHGARNAMNDAEGEEVCQAPQRMPEPEHDETLAYELRSLRFR